MGIGVLAAQVLVQERVQGQVVEQEDAMATEKEAVTKIAATMIPNDARTMIAAVIVLLLAVAVVVAGPGPGMMVIGTVEEGVQPLATGIGKEVVATAIGIGIGETTVEVAPLATVTEIETRGSKPTSIYVKASGSERYCRPLLRW